MAKIRINSVTVKNYRSFGGEPQHFTFPSENYKKPVAIVGYNNAGKTNLMNAIKYGLYEPVREDTLELKDFHSCKWENPPKIRLNFTADIVDDRLQSNESYFNQVEVLVDEEYQRIHGVKDFCSCYGNSQSYSKKWVIKQKAPVFYLNFHNIKEQISTQKTSWGNLKSFLGKHIKSLVDNDSVMNERKEVFNEEVQSATIRVLEGSSELLNSIPAEKSKLALFIESIKKNYSTNLRNNDCVVDFGLPDYGDVFLQMMFKIGLNGDVSNLIPITHFGDGFISMFVMAVIQAIAESNDEDKCLFLFEEPESFLHENHQEYFYKTVLCGLSEKGHQVIYTTHSDRMIDIFDTEGLIRLEFDEDTKQTVKRYNNVTSFSPSLNIENTDGRAEIINLKNYNAFIKSVEPNLNKILFSKKIILVEGPNDLMVYREVIRRKVHALIIDNESIINKEKYAETYLSFHNIAIVPHHGKITAILLMKLCEHIGVNCFAINDWDLEEDFVAVLSLIDNEEDLKQARHYLESTKKSVITTNWKLIKSARGNHIHFNVPKLEVSIGYNLQDKSSIGIWNRLQETELSEIYSPLFPAALEEFLGFRSLSNVDVVIEELLQDSEQLLEDDLDLPF